MLLHGRKRYPEGQHHGRRLTGQCRRRLGTGRRGADADSDARFASSRGIRYGRHQQYFGSRIRQFRVIRRIHSGARPCGSGRILCDRHPGALPRKGLDIRGLLRDPLRGNGGQAQPDRAVPHARLLQPQRRRIPLRYPHLQGTRLHAGRCGQRVQRGILL